MLLLPQQRENNGHKLGRVTGKRFRPTGQNQVVLAAQDTAEFSAKTQ
jgi:hypothetical protein